jgi:type IV secretion system protein VirB4
MHTQKIANAETFLSRYIPFSYSVAEHVVALQTGDYACTWKLQGLPFEGLSGAQAYAKMESLNLLIRGLSNGKFAFWTHRVRRYIQDSLTAPAEGFAKDVVERYYREMQGAGLMSTELYLTVLYRPFPQARAGLFGKPAMTEQEFKAELQSIFEILGGIGNQISTSLAEYQPQRLQCYIENGHQYSQQLEFYAYLINGVQQKIPYKNVPLNRYLPTTRLMFGNQIVEYRLADEKLYGAFIDIKDYADVTRPGILNGLIALPYECVETHSFSPMSTLNALSTLKLQRNRLLSAGDAAYSQIGQMNEAMDGVASGNFALGEYHYCIQVKASTPDKLKRARSMAIDELQNAGFLAVAIDLVVDQAYLSQLPGNWRSRPRIANLSSRNFCGMSSFHNCATGKRQKNPWGEAVTILRTPANQPYYFNFHYTPGGENSIGNSALGNCQIIGQSGSGKTVLALFLLVNLIKFGTQIVYFDKDRGAEIAIRAVGGKYLSILRGEPSGLNPFKMEPTEANVLFWQELIKFCTTSVATPHTTKDIQDIEHAISVVAMLPREIRCFETVMQNLPDVSDDSVAQRLRKWMKGGSLGWALDSDDDRLDFENTKIYGFDYTELLDDSQTCPAVMMYLMHRIENLIDGRRFAFFMDEYWKALSVSYFEDFAKNKQKTIRKQNGFGVYMTQSPSDTLQSPIARSLIEQTATFIFLPNPSADRNDYTDGFKLTDNEYNALMALDPNSRMFMVKQGQNITYARLDLKGFKDELKILSGTSANVERLEKIMSERGELYENWRQAFLSE